MSKRNFTLSSALALLLLALPASLAAQTSTSPTTCRMTYNLRGWSLGLKSATGEGTVTCDNGQTADVRIRAKGAGLSAGKYEIRDGVSVPRQTQSVADTRLVGKAEMTIDFTNVSLDPSKRAATAEDAQ